MAQCVSIEVLEDFLEARLDGDSSAAVAQHLSGCATCAGLRAALEADREIIGELRLHCAGDSGAAAGVQPVIPGYEIEREIRRGGQGVVYAARQLSTGRRVALKVLLRGPEASPEEKLRFERELSLAAGLSHPGIVTVHDGGVTADGWSFLAMELVDGEPLDDHLAARRPGLSPALALFRDLCDAVQHAHLRGVIHRDLKPSNILVTADGRPHVLDFGLAKPVANGADGSIGNTASGAFIGTLLWASPEQLLGDPRAIDVRTDVHALGLILFRLVTGRNPRRDPASLHALVRAITEDEPAAPSSVNPAVPRDLDAIALKAVARDSALRYASAGELLRDVERHLGGEPVEARGRDRWYVLRKAIRRHRVLVAAAGIVFAALGVASIVSFLFWKDSEAQGVRAKQAADVAISEAQKSDEVVGVFRKAFESGRSLRKGKAMTMADFLDDAARDLDANLPKNPRAEAILRTSLGVTWGKLGFLAKGVEQLRKARALHEQVGGADDPERLGAAIHLAAFLGALSPDHDAESLQILEDVIVRATRERGPADALVLRAKIERAGVWNQSGRAEQALGAAREIAAALDVRGPDPGLRARVDDVVASALMALGKNEEAEAAIRSALARDPTDDSRLNLSYFLTLLLLKQGREEEALANGEKALAFAESVRGEDQPVMQSLALVLAIAQSRRFRYAEAEAVLGKLLASLSRAPLLSSSDVQLAKATLGKVLCLRGAFAEAEAALRDAVALSEKAGGKAATGARVSRRLLAWALAGLDRWTEAEPILRDLAATIPSKPGPDPEAPFVFDLLARACVERGAHEEAADHWERAIATLPDDPALVIPGLPRRDVLRRYADVLEKLGRHERAEELRPPDESRPARDE
jgi:serine/threonine-protein kinase